MGVADTHRGVVRVNHARGQHHADGEGVQGLEKLRRLQPPAVHRLPGDAHALPLEDAFQAVQRQMVGPLADDHLGHQARSGQRAGDRFGRLGGQHHVLLRRRQAAFGQLFLAGVFLRTCTVTNKVEGRQSNCSLVSGGSSTRFSTPPKAAFSASAKS